MHYKLLLKAIGKTLGKCLIYAAIMVAAIGVGYMLTEHYGIIIPVIIVGGITVSIFASIVSNYRKLKSKL